MGAGAPQGNKNAEKHTEKDCIDLLDKAFKLCDEEDEYIVGGKKVTGLKYDFIGEIASKLGAYKQFITRDIPQRFPHLNTRVEKLKAKLESNCYYNTKKGIINTAAGIINLKSNHGWTDRNNTDITTGGKEINLTPISFVRRDKDK